MIIIEKVHHSSTVLFTQVQILVGVTLSVTPTKAPLCSNTCMHCADELKKLIKAVGLLEQIKNSKQIDYSTCLLRGLNKFSLQVTKASCNNNNNNIFVNNATVRSPGFSLRILVAGERCNSTREY